MLIFTAGKNDAWWYWGGIDPEKGEFVCASDGPRTSSGRGFLFEPFLKDEDINKRIMLYYGQSEREALYRILGDGAPRRPWIICYDMAAGFKNESLGELKAYLGKDISSWMPSAIPMSTDDKATLRSRVLEDVRMLGTEIMPRSSGRFNAMRSLLNFFNVDLLKHPEMLGSTIASVMAYGLMRGSPNGREGRVLTGLTPQIDILSDVLDVKKYKHIVDWYASWTEDAGTLQPPSTEVCGVHHRFSWAGLHGARKRYAGDGVIVSFDVRSFYPSLMMTYGFGREVINDWNAYEHIYKANLRLKSVGDESARLPFKLACNAVTGQLNMPGSLLYAPRCYRNITVNGQLLLLDLLEHIEAVLPVGAELIQTNTDGIYLRMDSMDDIEPVRAAVKAWETRTGLVTDERIIVGSLWQKDVNNYIIGDQDRKIIKARGEGSMPDDDRYEMACINKALRAYLVHGTPPERTIRECDSPRDFQMVFKARGLKHGETVLEEKIIRAYASKSPDDGPIYGQREDGSWYRMPGSPDHAIIDNLGCIPLDRIDLAWYANMVESTIARWIPLSTDNKKIKKTNTGNSTSKPLPVSKLTMRLLSLPIIPKAYGEYSHEEIAAAALRYLKVNGIAAETAAWDYDSLLGHQWKARVRLPGDENRYDGSLVITIYMTSPVNMQLHSFRPGAIIPEPWYLMRDPSMRCDGRELGAFHGQNPMEALERRAKADATRQVIADETARAEEKKREHLEQAIDVYERSPALADGLLNGDGVEYLRKKGVLDSAKSLLGSDIHVEARGIFPLLVPYRDLDGRITTLQRIACDGKRFFKGCTAPGGRGFIRIPGRTEGCAILCEGLATGLSVHAMTQGRFTVLVCGSASDVVKGGKRLILETGLNLIIAADDDFDDAQGVNHGMLAAEKVRGMAPDRVRVMTPPRR